VIKRGKNSEKRGKKLQNLALINNRSSIARIEIECRDCSGVGRVPCTHRYCRPGRLQCDAYGERQCSGCEGLRMRTVLCAANAACETAFGAGWWCRADDNQCCTFNIKTLKHLFRTGFFVDFFRNYGKFHFFGYFLRIFFRNFGKFHFFGYFLRIFFGIWKNFNFLWIVWRIFKKLRNLYSFRILVSDYLSDYSL
jgi:hypothetical protein